MSNDDLLTIGEVAARTGTATSALRYYEAEGLVSSVRTSGGQRRFHRDVLRRVGFILIAQSVGLSLDDVRTALATLPQNRTPTPRDWNRLARRWRPMIDDRIARLERLRDQLGECIGCGCLTLGVCKLYNPDDRAARFGPGARYLLGDPPVSRPARLTPPS